jgi:AcrR family transcriptional regulator
MARARAARRSLRDLHAEKTRELIIDAVIDQLGDTGVLEFSYFEVARRAGISVRTLYRHFPERDDLFAAVIQRINARVGFHEYPSTGRGMIDLARTLFPAFDENVALILAQQQTRLGTEVRSQGRRDRAKAARRAVDDTAPGLSPERREDIAAVCHCLLSSDAWRRMREDFGLDGKRSGEAIAWALETLLAAAAAENERAKRPRRGAS